MRYYKNSQGAVLDDSVDVEDISTMYFALDAFSGDLLWKNDVNADVDKMEEQGGQDHVKSKDQDRELSSLTGTETTKNISSDGMHQTVSTQDCLHYFGKIIVEESSGIQSHAFWHYSVQRGSIEVTFLWTILPGNKNAVDFGEFHNIKLQVHQHQVALRLDIVLSFDFLDTENNEHYVLVVISTLQK